jgi:nitrite reductase (NADH) large subunit
MKPKLVVVGNGMASIRVVELLLEQAPELYDISVFDGEIHGSYNRILLSPVLAGEKAVADIIDYPPAWYAERGVTLYRGDPVVAINRFRRLVKSQSGVELKYDRLLIATGSLPLMLLVPGVDLKGVIGFRNLEDVETMLEATRQLRYAVVIGGGLLGIEAANGLSRRGMKVTLVHRSDALLNQQLDPAAAALLRATLRERKLELRLNAQTRAIIGRDRVTGVSFDEGPDVSADLVVMAVGIKPNIDLAKKAGIRCDRAIVVDDTLQTYDPRIYAVGECVQHRGNTYGLVAPLWEQARVCATHLAQFGHSRYPGSVTSAKLKVSGIDLFSTGDFIGGAGTEDLVYRDPRRGVYKRLVLKDQQLVGAVLYGDVSDGAWYFDLIKSKTNITSLREHLVFGKSFCEAA